MIFAGESIHKSYGTLEVLKGVSISGKAGNIQGLIGANGAGKTTLFKILLGLVTPDSGSVDFFSSGAKKVGGIIEKPALYGYLNAAENLKVFAGIQGITLQKKQVTEALHRVGLSQDRKDPVGNFSTGMKQRLAIAIALLNNPSCLILDEPFSGLDPMGIAAFGEFIQQLAEQEGLCILLSSHIIDEMSRLCNHLSVLKNGKITHSDATENLAGNLINTYRFYGPYISESKVLKHFGAVASGNCMKLNVETTEMPLLFNELGKEQTVVTSMIPDLDLDGLFKSASK